MHKNTWILCSYWAVALGVLLALGMYAFQKPKHRDKPALFQPYVYLCAKDSHAKTSSIAIDQAAFLDTSPLFLATPLNATCHPKAYLELPRDLPLGDLLEPTLFLSQNLQVLPLQRVTIEDPLELIQWHYPIRIEPPVKTAPIQQKHSILAKTNTQCVDLLSADRKYLNLALNVQSLSLPLLEDMRILVLKDNTGYTLPFLKINTLGEEALDSSALEALSALDILKEWKNAYYEFFSSF